MPDSHSSDPETGCVYVTFTTLAVLVVVFLWIGKAMGAW